MTLGNLFMRLHEHVSESRQRVLGLTLAAGTLYAAVVECPDKPLFEDSFERLDLAAGLEGASQLADFAARFKQEIRRIQPIAVGILNTRKYSNWKYADAFKRVSLEAAVMLAVDDLSTQARSIKYVLITREGLPKAVGLDAEEFEDAALEEWGDGIQRYAKERVMAFATATALARSECG